MLARGVGLDGPSHQFFSMGAHVPPLHDDRVWKNPSKT